MRFTPHASKFANEPCGGVNLLITDRNKLQPVRVGVELAVTLRQLYHAEWQAEKLQNLIVNQQALNGILAGDDYAKLARRWSRDLRTFTERRKKFLVY